MRKFALAALFAITVPVCARAQGITAIATFPGGTTGQVQYNNGGRFGGVPGVTSTTLVGLGASTGTLRADFSAFVSTAGPLISTLGVSTGSLAAGGATTYVTVSGDNMTGPLASPVFHVIDGGLTVSPVAALSLFHTGGHAYIQSLTAGGGALAPMSILGSNVNIGPGAGGTNFQIGPVGDVNSKSITLSGGISAATGAFSGSVDVGNLVAANYSSAPVVYNSSASLTQDFMEWYTKDGRRVMVIDGAGGVRGLRINPETYDTSGTADLDLFGYNGGAPMMQFRRQDTGITMNDDLLEIAVRDHDTSIGGQSQKAGWKISAGPVDWSSNTPMEQWQIWQLSRLGGAPADFMVLTTTGLMVVGWPGTPEETQASCSTCTGQFISKTDGHGFDIVGTLAVSGTSRLGGQVAISTTVGGNCSLRVRAGTGAGGGCPPEILYSVYSGSNTIGHPAGTLMDAAIFTISTNTLVRSGDAIRVECVAVATTTNISKDLRIDVDGDETTHGAVTTTGTQWMVTGDFAYETAGNLVGWSQRSRGDAIMGADVDESILTDMTANFNVSCRIRSSQASQPAGEPDMKLLTMKVWYIPAP